MHIKLKLYLPRLEKVKEDICN